MANRMNSRADWRAQIARYRAERAKHAERAAKETRQVEKYDERIAEAERTAILSIVQRCDLSPEELEARLIPPGEMAQEGDIPDDNDQRMEELNEEMDE